MRSSRPLWTGPVLAPLLLVVALVASGCGTHIDGIDDRGDDPAARPYPVGAGHELVLSLPVVGRLELDATLRTIAPASPAERAAPKVRMGFRFEAVPPQTANRIQRYVQRLEVTQLRELRRR